MGVINAIDLRPGMVLEQDVVLASGRRLLAKGAAIEEKHLRIFKAWGVTEAFVEHVSRDEVAQTALESLEPLALEYATSLCGIYFPANMEDSEAGAEIQRLTMMRLARRIMQGEEPPRPQAASQYEAQEPEVQPGETSPNDVVNGHFKLASFPDVCRRIQEVINDPRASSTKLAEIISRDTGLAASLLRLVNSPVYGFPSQVDSISRAVTLIGTKELSTLSYGVVAVRVFKDIPANFLDMERFWQHAAACGVFCRIFSSYVEGLDEERAFVAGLLHDIGRLVLVNRYPKASSSAFAMAFSQSRPLHDTEQEVFGFNHARVGSHLLKAWQFPDSLRDMVSFHHEPGMAHAPKEAAVLHLADILSVCTDLMAGSPRPIPTLDPNAWDAAQLPLSALEAAFGQFDRQYNEVKSVLFSDEAPQNGPAHGGRNTHEQAGE